MLIGVIKAQMLEKRNRKSRKCETPRRQGEPGRSLWEEIWEARGGNLGGALAPDPTGVGKPAAFLCRVAELAFDQRPERMVLEVENED